MIPRIVDEFVPLTVDVIGPEEAPKRTTPEKQQVVIWLTDPKYNFTIS